MGEVGEMGRYLSKEEVGNIHLSDLERKLTRGTVLLLDSTENLFEIHGLIIRVGQAGIVL